MKHVWFGGVTDLGSEPGWDFLYGIWIMDLRYWESWLVGNEDYYDIIGECLLISHIIYSYILLCQMNPYKVYIVWSQAADLMENFE